jgi:hypothetical protein
MTFTDGVDSVEKGCQIGEEVKEMAVNAYIEGPDMEGVRKRLKMRQMIGILLYSIRYLLYLNVFLSKTRLPACLAQWRAAASSCFL